MKKIVIEHSHNLTQAQALVDGEYLTGPLGFDPCYDLLIAPNNHS